MNCKKAEQLLVDHAEQTLAGRKKKHLERHLETCESCRLQLEGIIRLREEVRSLSVPEPTESEWERFHSKLTRRLAEIDSERAARGSRRLLLKPMAAAAAVAAGFLLVLALWINFSMERKIDSNSSGKVMEQLSSEDSMQSLPSERDDKFLIALENLSDADLEDFVDDAALLLEEDSGAFDEVFLYSLTEPDPYEALEDLSPEEYDEVLKRLASI